MAGGNRYADRFFERPGSGPETVDLGAVRPADAVSGAGDGGQRDHRGPDDDHDRPWHASVVARVSLVAALVVGAAGGAYGLERWREHQATVAERSEVDLLAWAGQVAYADNDRIEVAFRFGNEGAHPIVIRDLHLENPRMDTVVPPRPVTVGPGERADQVVSLELVCDGESAGAGWAGPGAGWGPGPGPVTEQPVVVVEVETVDGQVVRRTVPAAVGTEVTSMVMYSCSQDEMEVSFSSSYAQLAVEEQGDPSVVGATITIDLLAAPPEVDIDAVRMSTDGFAIIAEPAVANSSSSQTSIAIDIRVADCASAVVSEESDMSIFVDGRLEGTNPGTIMIEPSAGLALALARLASSVCG